MSPDGAFVALPGAASKHGPASDGTEGFSRTLLLHSFRIAGAPETANLRHTDRFLEGLHNGLRRSRAGAQWLPITRRGHAIPESASIALALGIAREQLWSPLDAAAQSRIIDWLSAAVSAPTYDNNWRLFGPVAGAFLTSVGVEAPGNAAARELALTSLSAWEQADGWVSDGDSGTFDYYSSFALHFYPLMLSSVFGDEEFASRMDSARRFLATLPELISGDGGPVYFGRSLTYRFGIMASVSAGAVAGCLPFEAAAGRAFTERVVNHFLSRGAVAPDGTIRRGWFGEDSSLVQAYSGPAGSYWASKTFANLLLGPSDAYWTGTAKAPMASAGTVLAGGMLTQASPTRDVIRLANHASVSRSVVIVADEPEDPQYSRIEYSTASTPSGSDFARTGGFVVALKGGLAAPSPLEPTGAGEAWAASRAPLRIALSDAPRKLTHATRGKASATLEGFDITMATIRWDEWLVHIARFPRGNPWRGEVRWAGNAVATVGTDAAVGRNGLDRPMAIVSGATLASCSVGLLGFTAATTISVANAPFAPTGEAPVLTGRMLRRQDSWFVVASAFGGESAMPAVESAPQVSEYTQSALTLTTDAATATVHFGDTLTVEKNR